MRQVHMHTTLPEHYLRNKTRGFYHIIIVAEQTETIQRAVPTSPIFTCHVIISIYSTLD